MKSQTKISAKSRILAMLLTVLMLVGLVPFALFAELDDPSVDENGGSKYGVTERTADELRAAFESVRGTLRYFQDFEDLTVDNITSWTSLGGGIYSLLSSGLSIATDGDNKALKKESNVTTGSDSAIRLYHTKHGVSSTDDIYASVDIKLFTGSYSEVDLFRWMLRGKYNSADWNKEWRLISLGANGEIKVSDSTVGKLSSEEYTRVAVATDRLNNKYYVYINDVNVTPEGVTLLSEADAQFIAGKGVNDATDMPFSELKVLYAGATDPGAYLDNITFASRPVGKVVEACYPYTAADLGRTFAAQNGSLTFYQTLEGKAPSASATNFNTDADFGSILNFWNGTVNTTATEYRQEADGNMAMYIGAGRESGQGYPFRFANSDTLSGDFFISFDLKMNGSKVKPFATFTIGSQSKETSPIRVDASGNITVAEEVKGKLSNTKYTRIAISADKTNRIVNIYIDNVLVGTANLFAADTETSIAYVKMLVIGATTTSDHDGLYIDNVITAKGKVNLENVSVFAPAFKEHTLASLQSVINAQNGALTFYQTLEGKAPSAPATNFNTDADFGSVLNFFSNNGSDNTTGTEYRQEADGNMAMYIGAGHSQGDNYFFRLQPSDGTLSGDFFVSVDLKMNGSKIKPFTLHHLGTNDGEYKWVSLDASGNIKVGENTVGKLSNTEYTRIAVSTDKTNKKLYVYINNENVTPGGVALWSKETQNTTKYIKIFYAMGATSASDHDGLYIDNFIIAKGNVNFVNEEITAPENKVYTAQLGDFLTYSKNINVACYQTFDTVVTGTLASGNVDGSSALNNISTTGVSIVRDGGNNALLARTLSGDRLFTINTNDTASQVNDVYLSIDLKMQGGKTGKGSIITLVSRWDNRTKDQHFSYVELNESGVLYAMTCNDETGAFTATKVGQLSNDYYTRIAVKTDRANNKLYIYVNGEMVHETKLLSDYHAKSTGFTAQNLPITEFKVLYHNAAWKDGTNKGIYVDNILALNYKDTWEVTPRLIPAESKPEGIKEVAGILRWFNGDGTYKTVDYTHASGTEIKFDPVTGDMSGTKTKTVIDTGRNFTENFGIGHTVMKAFYDKVQNGQYANAFVVTRGEKTYLGIALKDGYYYKTGDQIEFDIYYETEGAAADSFEFEYGQSHRWFKVDYTGESEGKILLSYNGGVAYEQRAVHPTFTGAVASYEVATNKHVNFEGRGVQSVSYVEKDETEGPSAGDEFYARTENWHTSGKVADFVDGWNTYTFTPTAGGRWSATETGNYLLMHFRATNPETNAVSEVTNAIKTVNAMRISSYRIVRMEDFVYIDGANGLADDGYYYIDGIRVQKTGCWIDANGNEVAAYTEGAYYIGSDLKAAKYAYAIDGVWHNFDAEGKYVGVANGTVLSHTGFDANGNSIYANKNYEEGTLICGDELTDANGVAKTICKAHKWEYAGSTDAYNYTFTCDCGATLVVNVDNLSTFGVKADKNGYTANGNKADGVTSFNKANLILSNQIKVVFGLDIDETGKAAGGKILLGTMKDFVNGTTTAISVADGVISGDYRKFAYGVSAKDVNTPVIAVYVDAYGAYHGSIYTYTIQNYIDTVKAGDNAELKELVSAIDVYGANAKYYFTGIGEEPEAIEDVTFDGINDIVINATEDNMSGSIIAPAGATLLLKDKITIRAYFTLADVLENSIENYTFTIDGVEVEATKYDSEEIVYYIEKEVLATELAQSFVFKCETNDGATNLAYTLSALSYAKSVNASENPEHTDALKNLMRATYLYYEATVAFAN